jgi:hypothetical protein
MPNESYELEAMRYESEAIDSLIRRSAYADEARKMLGIPNAKGSILANYLQADPRDPRDPRYTQIRDIGRKHEYSMG